jgi:hypothetical protein
VTGTAADTNTIRIGLLYSSGVGQNQTFIAGIYGTDVSAWRQVVIDANGQLGTINPQTGGGLPIPVSTSAGLTDGLAAVTKRMQTQEQQLKDQQATIAELQKELAGVKALLRSVSGRK